MYQAPIAFDEGHCKTGAPRGQGHGNSDFTELSGGCCRVSSDPSNRMGEYDIYNATNISECRQKCKDEDDCVGFEWYSQQGTGRCEIHFTTIDVDEVASRPDRWVAPASSSSMPPLPDGHSDAAAATSCTADTHQWPYPSMSGTHACVYAMQVCAGALRKTSFAHSPLTSTQ